MFGMRTAISTVLLLLCFASVALAQRPQSPDTSFHIRRITTGQLRAALKSKNKPLVLQVGMARLYRHSHIPGADYAGPANEPEGLDALRKRVQSVAKGAPIVIYCGCCPWDHCPNIQPAYAELHRLGFTNVKALYLPNNFKSDWVDKGFPTTNGS